MIGSVEVSQPWKILVKSTGTLLHKGKQIIILCINYMMYKLYKRLSKQSWGWWLETPSRSLLRHCNDLNIVWQHWHLYSTG